MWSDGMDKHRKRGQFDSFDIPTPNLQNSTQNFQKAENLSSLPTKIVASSAYYLSV